MFCEFHAFQQQQARTITLLVSTVFWTSVSRALAVNNNGGVSYNSNPQSIRSPRSFRASIEILYFHLRLLAGYQFYFSFVNFYARSQNFEKRLLSSSCPSVRPHRTTRLPLSGLRLNLAFSFFFSKICRENSSFIKIRQE